MADPFHELFRQAEASMSMVNFTVGQQPPVAPAQAPALGAPQPVVDPPPIKPEWERELDSLIAQHGDQWDITLLSGTVLRVTAEPKSAQGAIEVSRETFKRLSRAAVIMGGRVVNVVAKERADDETRRIIEQGSGFWASPSVFVEVDKTQGEQRSSTGGVLAVPTQPDAYPPVDPKLWIAISAAHVTESVPMRSGAKVIGSLLRTVNGPVYARHASDREHMLGLGLPWASAGGYCIDKDVYDRYLTDPQTVIKVVRGAAPAAVHYYFTTSGWVQKHGGVIKSWGAQRIVMPLSGKFWLVTNSSGEVVE